MADCSSGKYGSKPVDAFLGSKAPAQSKQLGWADRCRVVWLNKASNIYSAWHSQRLRTQVGAGHRVDRDSWAPEKVGAGAEGMGNLQRCRATRNSVRKKLSSLQTGLGWESEFANRPRTSTRRNCDRECRQLGGCTTSSCTALIANMKADVQKPWWVEDLSTVTLWLCQT